jgi:hypothetical protein
MTSGTTGSWSRGHEWRVTAQNLAGCTRCSAHLAAELHPTRNADLDPYALGASAPSDRVVALALLRGEWQAPVAQRSHSPDGCLSCAKRRAALKRWRARRSGPS